MKKFTFALSVFFIGLNSYASPLIIGGKLAKKDSAIIKSTVAIMEKEDGFFFTYCTGSVIAPKIVLTAAHCLAEVLSSELYIGSGVQARDSKKVKVAEFKYFTKDYFSNFWSDLEENPFGKQDIALLITEEELEMSPVPIGHPSEIDIKTRFTMAGYGIKSEDPEKAMTGTLYYVDNPFYKKSDSAIYVLERQNGRTAQGDSGGPLFTEKENKLTLHGILSNGADQSYLHVSEYTHPYYYLDWMNCALEKNDQFKIDSLSEQKPCDGIGLQKIEKLPSFNQAQCADQMPGFAINKELGCIPASKEVCLEFAKKIEIDTTWNAEEELCDFDL